MMAMLSYSDGDVILRCGSVDFRVHILILSLASPFFKTTFSLPQPEQTAEEKQTDGVPVISLPEPAEVIDKLMRWIYPLSLKPGIETIQEAKALSDAADKYDIECAITHIQASLTSLLANELNPLRAWALAVIFKHADARLGAAIRFTHIDPSCRLPRVEELRTVSALDFADLVAIREEAHNRGKMAIGYEYSAWWGCKKCCKDAYQAKMRGDDNGWPGWYSAYHAKVMDRNPFCEDVSSDGLFDACVASSDCEGCRRWYEQLSPSSRPATQVRKKIENVNTWIKNNACKPFDY